MSYFNCFQKQLIFIVIVLLPFVVNRPQDENMEEPRKDFRPGKYIPELYGAHLGRYMPDYRGYYQHIHVPYDGGYGDRGEKYEHDLSGVFRRPFSLGMGDHLRFMIDFNFNGSGWQVIQFDWVRDGEEDRQYKYIKENKLWEVTSAGYDYSNGSGGTGSELGKFGESDTVNGDGGSNAEEDTNRDTSSDTNGDTNVGTNRDENFFENIDANSETTSETTSESNRDTNSGTNEVTNVDTNDETSGVTNVDISGITNEDTNVHVTGVFKPNAENSSGMRMEESRTQDAQSIQDTLRELLDYIQTNIIPTLN